MKKHYSNGTDLDIALQFVIESPDDFHCRKRFHSVFLRSKFFTPTLLDNPMQDEKFFPLRLYDNNQTFFITFDSKAKFDTWCVESKADRNIIGVEEIFGHELIDCLGNNVYLGLNPGSKSYFEIPPQHIQFLKKAIDKTKNPDSK